MASSMALVGAGFLYRPKMEVERRFRSSCIKTKPSSSYVSVRAEAINPEIRKTEQKVVDSVQVSELSNPLTAYCRAC
ncbi:hypothetical protein AMTR_s00069p00194900 [Amborella trichopoda]|uniref:Uncharacterized protein n=1 Tax=Amborella trichopoda TaxID=13333 RepID=U5D1I3_AMBTC|nr:hypothetical protein AMTR_s00069p00194900 [Amborella trichopoda]